MSRFLFLPMAAFGHVNPSLAVASALVERGHQVTYLLPERFREVVVATGAELVTYDEDLAGGRTGPPPDTAGGAPPIGALMQMLMGTAEGLAAPLLALHDRLRPDLVVDETMSLWGRLVAAGRGTRSVALSPSYVGGPMSPIARRFASAVPAADGPPFDVGRLAAVAGRYGVRLDDPTAFLWAPAQESVVFMPAEFHPDHEELGAGAHFVGPATGRPEPVDGFDLERIRTTPGVYVSLGTVFNDRKAFFQACLDAFGGGDRPVVLNHGSRLRAADFPDVPGNVQLASHVPQLRVLEHSAAFVTHGGMGSTMEAIVQGVPLVVVPQMVEQQVTADRVAELGIGMRLDPADATPATLADAVDTVVSDPAYRAAAARMGAAARRAGGGAAAADVLVAAAAG